MQQYDRRHFLKTTILTITGLMTGCSALRKKPETKPNILFIAVDDLRPELGCYGHKWIKSPNIDELAAGGIVFNRAYCQVAVCGASRASLLTGLRPTPKRFLDYKTWVEKDTPGAMTLPEEFKKNGYHCISNGKVFHHSEDTADRSWSEPPWRPEMDNLTFLDPESNTMIVAGPGVKAGQKSDRLVEFVDIYPSLCDLVGITTVNKGLQGTSFKPLLMNPQHPWKKAAFSKYGPAVSAITERYNYVEFHNGEKMLYDLKNDAAENINIAELEDHQELVQQLSRMLNDGWLKALP